MVVVERLGARYHKVVGVRRVKVMPKNNLPKPPGYSILRCIQQAFGPKDFQRNANITSALINLSDENIVILHLISYTNSILLE